MRDKTAIKLERTAWTAGAITAIFSAAVTVLVVFAAKVQPSVKLSIATLIIGILVTTITTISIASKCSDKAAQHHGAAVEYGKVLRKIEQSLANPWEMEGDAGSTLKLIRKKLDRIPSGAPAIPPRIMEETARRANARKTCPDLDGRMLLP